jgi:hypothetical protein
MSRARDVLVAVAVALVILGTCAGTAMAEEFNRYALESVSASLSSTQAGAHADLTTFFKLTHREGGKEAPYALTRDVVFELPPGMLGNPQAIPRCTIAQMGNLPAESECPIDSQVGVTELRLAGEIAAVRVEPIYNLEPPTGETDVVARLGFFAATYPTFVNIRVDPCPRALGSPNPRPPSGVCRRRPATMRCASRRVKPKSANSRLEGARPRCPRRHSSPTPPIARCSVSSPSPRAATSCPASPRR